MFKQLLWISPFFVLQIMIKSCCCCFECCFYFNQAPSSIFGIYSLSTSALGCNILCIFNSVFVSIFLNFQIFQSMMPKLYCTTGTARLLIASILFLPLSSVLRIALTLLLYSFRIFSFIIFAVLDTITFIYTQVFVYSFLVQLLYFCVNIYYY